MDDFYYFPPWRKQFYFSIKLFQDKKYIYFLYYPYITLSKLVWKIWLKQPFFRRIFKVKNEKMPILFIGTVKKLELYDYLFQVNTGSIGVEQKMTILAYGRNDEKLFIKVGTSKLSKQLIDNERKALLDLENKLLIPKVLKYYNENETSILATEAINAQKNEDIILNEALFNYIFCTGKISFSLENSLLYCFAHGDCCPWNFLKYENGELVLIDWELSNLYPAGYDLFTYIFQTPFLIAPYKDIKTIFEENQLWITRYFDELEIKNKKEYLNAFISIKISLESVKSNSSLLNKWKQLNDYLNKKNVKLF